VDSKATEGGPFTTAWLSFFAQTNYILDLLHTSTYKFLVELNNLHFSLSHGFTNELFVTSKTSKTYVGTYRKMDE